MGFAAYFGAERVTRGIVYRVEGKRVVKLDLHQPWWPGPHPLIVAVHGGFWKQGDRSQLSPYCIWFVRRGYSVACVDYGLSPEQSISVALDDIAESVRFLRRNAAQYSLDPQRIALMGASSGAHLAALVALRKEPGTQVQALVDLYGPTDLTARHMAEDYTVQDVFGHQVSHLRDFSPVCQVQGPCPPVLIVQGDKDPIVPPQQSRDFYEKLHNTGHQARLLMVHNAGHDLMPVGGQPDPSLFQVASQISNFLDESLRAE